jgi:hypothetical protein
VAGGAEFISKIWVSCVTGDQGFVSVCHGFKKPPPRTRAALERNGNFRTPSGAELDVGPSLAIFGVEMKERDALEVKDSVGALRDAGKLSELAKHVLEVEKIFMAGMSHASVPVPSNCGVEGCKGALLY